MASVKERDNTWLQLPVCPLEFKTREKCTLPTDQCPYAHPQDHVKALPCGYVVSCHDFVFSHGSKKRGCVRNNCKFFHPPMHLRIAVINAGKNNKRIRAELFRQIPAQPSLGIRSLAPGGIMPSPQWPPLANTAPYLWPHPDVTDQFAKSQPLTNNVMEMALTTNNLGLHSGYGLHGYPNPFPTIWYPAPNLVDAPKSTGRSDNSEPSESSPISSGLLPSPPRKRNSMNEVNPMETKRRFTTNSDEVPPGFEAPLVFYQPWSPTSAVSHDTGVNNAFLQYQQQLGFAQQAMAYQQSLLPMGYPFNINKQ
ncbi:uncharacterized protein LOC131878915 isoform X2 [Tigriopus californicus]|uniref:uncharacterized protein LOC131878915 isoform X2 n=1 Tax=Tigriopus californicus TaxID=6832 RepID=UPI0027DA41C3|nr:uncharacterized protein LOC131878915 isoform X2 [Tigriopus californicus]